MPGTDPNLLRQAAAEFQPRRRARYQNLQPCREVILELRGKGASCESIAELLTRYEVKTSRTMVTEFVGLLAESKGGRRKPRSMWVTALATTPPAEPPMAPTPATTAMPAPIENTPVKSRGPRIAKIELLKPNEKPD